MVKPKSRTRRKLILLILVLVVGYVAVVYIGIVHQSTLDESRKTDAIVVFGAAEYVGKPSPVFKARLDHAAELFRRGLAPIVITTGGSGADPNYNEGDVGRDYLRSLGIPDANLIGETQSNDTAESARRASAILHANRLNNCLAVSDAYHIFRIKQMLAREGITAYGAPRPNSQPKSLIKKNEAILHEITSYTLWLLRLS